MNLKDPPKINSSIPTTKGRFMPPNAALGPLGHTNVLTAAAAVDSPYVDVARMLTRVSIIVSAQIVDFLINEK